MSEKQDDTVTNTPLEYFIAGLVVLTFGLLYYLINHGWSGSLPERQSLLATDMSDTTYQAAPLSLRDRLLGSPEMDTPPAQSQLALLNQEPADSQAQEPEPVTETAEETTTDSQDTPPEQAAAAIPTEPAEEIVEPASEPEPQETMTATDQPAEPATETTEPVVQEPVTEPETAIVIREVEPVEEPVTEPGVTETVAQTTEPEKYYLPDGTEIEIADTGFENELKQAFLNNDTDSSLLFDNISFDVGSARLDPSSMPQIRATAALLNTYKDKRILIRGHSDNTGGVNVNSLLSLERSDSMKNELTNLGIDGHRIEIEGVGPLDPVASNDTAAGRQKNRRIELKLIE